MAYLGEKKLGNFRVRGAKSPHKNSERYKERPGMSEAHLKMIRDLPCSICNRDRCGEAHHLKSQTGERGTGLRSTDRWAVPMCHDDHMEVERAGTKQETAWFCERGVINVHLLAQDLWGARGEPEKMRAILAAHKGQKP